MAKGLLMAGSGLIVLSMSFPLAAQVIEEVVVSVQKVEESAQSVPISVTAMSSDFVYKSNIKNGRDMMLYVPGLSGRSGSEGESVFAIRGVGTNAFSVSADSSVGIFVDDIYQGHPIIAGAPFFDVERIEVVKGPQGTLFGRNTSAGAISVISKKPERGVTYFDTLLGIGTEGQQLLEAKANLSNRDDSGVRISAKWEQRDGTVTNTATGNDDLNNVDNLFLRLSAEKDLSDTLSGGLLLEHYTSDAQFSLMPFDPNDRQAALDNAVVEQNPPPDPGDLDVSTTRAGLRFQWDINDSLYFKSLTSYLDSELVVQPVDGDNTTLNILNFREPSSYEYLAQDLRLHGSTDSVNWFLGFNYRTEDNFANTEFSYNDEDVFLALLGDTCTNVLGPDGLDFLCNTNVVEPSNAFADNTAWGLYGDLAWHVNDDVTVRVGGRYSVDDKEIVVDTPGSGSAVSLATSGGDSGLVELVTAGPVRNEEDWSNFSPRLAVDYRVGEDTMLYGSVSQGYKAGGFNSSPNAPLSALGPGEVQQPNAFEPEESTAVELGVKSTFAEGRARVNAALFYIDYQDYQLESFTGLSFNITNVADAENVGLEVESTFLVGEAVTLMLNYAYLDSEIQSGAVQADPALPPVSVAGSRLPFSPKNSFSAIAEWTRPLSNWGAELTLRGEYSFIDEQILNLPAGNVSLQEDHEVINLRASIDDLDGVWSVALIGQNVTDERWFDVSQEVLGPVGVPNIGELWSLQFSYRFGR